MRKLSVMLIAVLATASFLAVPAAAQFSIPKIKIPKIPKTDTTSQPTSTDSPANPSSNSSSPTPSGDVRGRPIQGARITFSNNPDGSNPKSSFTSSEYIYGHLDLGGRTMYDAFGFKNFGPNAKYYYISYYLNVQPAGKQVWEDDWHNGRRFVLVTKEDAQKTSWNFDVLPDPSNVSTRGAVLEDEGVENFKFVSGMYIEISDVDSARSMFPQNGNYTVDVTLYGNSYDDWGKTTGKWDEFPTASSKFALQFSGTDGQTIVANAKKARDSMESSKNRREMLHAMPDWWGKAWTGTDARLAPARLVPMIKGYIGKWNLTYMKHMIWNFSGPAWVVEKNDLGIPRYRMFNTTIYIIYRDPKDNSCQLGGLTMQEDYSGAGTYGDPYLSGISDVKYIDCAVVK